MTENPEGVWRDEERLPLSELAAAVATSPADGQTDDPTGNDAGIERPATGEGDPDPTSAAGRAMRSDFTGPTGPN
ncbi:hypothetical protein ACIA8K_40195 [Catenuloplanes sp. NPDC051500]|uniref:hypothetical protein n=1 Tax=Catenuloplanes sp. NPDC051500 TaxID=3363959 RepID=UPI0037BAF463